MKLLATLLLTIATTRAAERPPNIVFIIADDLGITDIGAYARHFNKAEPEELFYETPHLDKLVADGIAFSQSYANQLCTPTAPTSYQPSPNSPAILHPKTSTA